MTYIYIQTYICMCVCMSIYVYTHLYMYEYQYMYKHLSDPHPDDLICQGFSGYQGGNPAWMQKTIVITARLSTRCHAKCIL